MRSVGLLILVVVCWSAASLPRVWEPFRAGVGGHDAWISSQIGAYAYRHVTLGPGVTRRVNLTAVRYDGAPVFHTSYTPLASWVLSVPMLLGVPLYPAVRLVMFATWLWFLISLWLLSRKVWGLYVANLAVALAALSPAGLQYGLSCIWEFLGIGPAFFTLYLVSVRRPSRWRTVGMMACGTVAVMYSWVYWLLLALYKEMRERRAGTAWLVGGALVALPVAVQLWALHAAGTTVAAFLQHNMDRMSGVQWVEAEGVRTYRELAGIVVKNRAIPMLGAIPFAAAALMGIALCVAVMARGRGAIRGANWLVLLVAYAVPLNLLARNVATFHDFFMVLLVPYASVSAALLVERFFGGLADATGRRAAMTQAGVLTVLAFFATSTWMERREYVPSAEEYAVRTMAFRLAEEAKDDAVILASRPMLDPVGVMGESLLGLQEVAIKPRFGCLTPKTGLLCRDWGEMARAVSALAPERRVVVLDRDGELEPLPRGGTKYQFARFTVAVYGG